MVSNEIDFRGFTVQGVTVQYDGQEGVIITRHDTNF